MIEPKFKYGEAIRWGWKMTKKYLGVIFLCAVIYILLQAPGGVLESAAGKGEMTLSEVRTIAADAAQADQVYAFFKEAGYLNERGKVQAPLQQVMSPADLKLPADLEAKRQGVYDFFQDYRYRLPFPKFIYFTLMIILWLVNMVVQVGFVRVNLKLARDQEPQASDLFVAPGLLIPYMLGGICYILAVLGGLILLIVPGIIFAIMFQMYAYLVVDKGMGPIESLKRSKAITKGSKRRLLVFGFWLFLLNIGGLLCLFIGVFFTLTVSSIAMAFIYDKLENAPEATSITA